MMYSAFQDCNLTVTEKTLGSILRQGVNLIGAGLLDMIKKQSGQTDSSKVLGFVGMLLAARNIKRDHPNALIASVDGKIARLWLKLGLRSGPERCDLLSVRKDPDGAYRITSIEVKTTQDPTLPDEEERIQKAAAQIESTAAVINNAISADGPFGAPRSEMLKEVLVRATANRWSSEEDDSNSRLTWGPWLKEIFVGVPDQPTVRVDGEVIVVKLRSAEQPRQYTLPDRKVPITVKIITESLAEELFGEKLIAAVAPAPKQPSPTKPEKAQVVTGPAPASPPAAALTEAEIEKPSLDSVVEVAAVGSTTDSRDGLAGQSRCK
jgi:hypothetical protein